MNSALLLEHYARIADAPDAIARLRRFVLDLAVRGKLVNQNAADEPASELLKRIAANNAGRRKASEQLALDEAQKFAVPSGWELVPLGNVVAHHFGGGTPSKTVSAYWDGNIRWASVKDVGKSKYLDDTIDRITPEGLVSSSSNLIEPGHLIVVTRMGLGKVSINRTEVAINQDLRALKFGHGVDLEYAYNFFLTHAFEGTGLTVKGIKLAELLHFPFPLPPFAEQKRIVVKVEELMRLCDQLEAARAEREAARDRLAAATLARLNAPDYEAFPTDARFALDNFTPLTTRPDQIKQLRQTILNLAVRGKLVEQVAADEPASKLLNQLVAEKARLARDGIIPRPKDRERDPNYLTESLPATWLPIALGDICSLVTSGSRGWGEFYAETGPGFIRAQNIRFGRLRLDGLASVNPPAGSEGARTQVAKGDLLVVITGAGVTNPALLYRDLGEAYVSQHIGLVRPIDHNLSPWLLLCLMADAGGRSELTTRAYGAGKPGLNLDNIRSLSIPFAPLAEQQRIVAKVDELMALCDQLETSLNESEQIRSRLLESVLHNALEPA